ncbi:LOW QUALITY PROTEIN: hepatitis A virus cellular receptor 1-like [Eptesicus fuscus]|uniref:LOW QUALITY PROTEIN: hepatitis A virus cellular receptor 1-like n=1 Tax=Eptesicus fuscus TaxID=29078 RepID=UPI0024045215|nr:LOW QUALITY PROTEIN: hepatitis A virus cellular receptor 1-like [Eptesicus fuscus]
MRSSWIQADTIMPPWVAFPSLILLWADAVVSVSYVTGVVGQSVTLPCIFSTAHEISPMCWGRRACPSFNCSNELMTDGYHVTFEKDKRYRMNGIIFRGNLSLIIQNAALSDTGTYCCHIEFKGWFSGYKKNIFLEIKPAPPKVTSVPTPSKVFTSAPTTPAPTLSLKTETTSSSAVQKTETQPIRPQETSTTSSSLNSSCPTGGNNTVTQPSDFDWQYNETHMSLTQNTQRNTSKLYIGLSSAAIILLTILAAILTKKYLCGKRKVFHISKEFLTGTSQNETSVRYQPHENLCFENDLYNVYQDPAVL